jgi:hypothetical protein
MLYRLAIAALLAAAPALPARADTYPVSGRWGESSRSEKGAIDCTGKRVIGFNGNQRTDSKGGVPGYRIKSVTEAGPSSFRIIDEFSTGQISHGYLYYTLHKVDDDHIVLQMQQGGTLNLQRCK